MYTIPPQTTIGHIHLTVGDLDRALAFYQGILGFQITTRYGPSAVFLSAGGYYHHVGLNTWQGVGASRAPRGHAGMYHVAILYPDRIALATVLRRLIDAEYPVTGFADHGVSEAIYLDDPDGNGVELYVDRPKSEWKYAEDGSVMMVTEPLDVDALLALAQPSIE
jgi:catechol 2,3-dioxygenase